MLTDEKKAELKKVADTVDGILDGRLRLAFQANEFRALTSGVLALLAENERLTAERDRAQGEARGLRDQTYNLGAKVMSMESDIARLRAELQNARGDLSAAQRALDWHVHRR